MPGLPREELELLSSLARGEETFARLKERALFAAGATRGRPFLAEALARAEVCGVPLFVHEPSLAGEDTAPEEEAILRAARGAADLAGAADELNAVPPPRARILPIDFHDNEDRWTVRGPVSAAPWILRVSLLGGESEFLEAAAAGYAGVWGPVDGRDVFALQYLVELARDLAITYVPAVGSEGELESVLRTDVPYVGFGRGFGETPEGVLALHRACAPRLPVGLHVLVLLPSGANQHHARMALAAGAHAVVGPCACVAAIGNAALADASPAGAGAAGPSRPGGAKT